MTNEKLLTAFRAVEEAQVALAEASAEVRYCFGDDDLRTVAVREASIIMDDEYTSLLHLLREKGLQRGPCPICLDEGCSR